MSSTKEYEDHVYPFYLKRMEQMHSPPESSVLRMVVVLARWRRIIALSTLITVLVTVIVVLVIPVSYTGTALMMTPSPTQGSASALLSQLGSLTSALPEALEGGLRNPQETYVGILSSRTVADELISRFELQKLYKRKTLVDTRKILARHTHVEATKGLLIRITVEDKSAQRAADMANAYVDALYRINKHLALTEGSQRRVFVEQQVSAETDALSKAEVAFTHIQETTGVIHLTGQAEVTLRTISQLRAELVSRELQLQELRSIATEHNEKVGEMETAIAALREQLTRAERGTTGSDTTDYFLPAGKVPAAGLEYVRAVRQLRYHEALFETLSKQYEAARLEEAKSPPLLQVVDRATASDKRAWPPRTLLVLLAGLLAFVFVSIFALAKDACARAAAEPAHAEQLAILRSIMRRKPHSAAVER
jgi:tyrosine-protein kinase Etk/Wzc